MAHLVTGYAGSEHIQSSDQGSFNAAFFGAGQFVMDIGSKFSATITSNNNVRIADGDLLMYGRHVRINPNTYEDMKVQNGTSGKNRIDLIVMTYEKNASSGIETAYLEVIKGTETTGVASEPSYTNGNILNGALKNQMPLYALNINGVVLSSVKRKFEICPTYKALAERYEQEFVTSCTNHLDSLNVLDSQNAILNNSAGNQLSGAKGVKEIYETLNNGKANSSHTHDDRYYTESEVDSKLNGKSNNGHVHDDRYYTEYEVNSMLGGKANSIHSHTKSQIMDFGHTHDERYYTKEQANQVIAQTSDSVKLPVGTYITRISKTDNGAMSYGTWTYRGCQRVETDKEPLYSLELYTYERTA